MVRGGEESTDVVQDCTHVSCLIERTVTFGHEVCLTCSIRTIFTSEETTDESRSDEKEGSYGKGFRTHGSRGRKFRIDFRLV